METQKRVRGSGVFGKIMKRKEYDSKKFLFFDLDGTLVNSELISVETVPLFFGVKDLLEKVKKAEVKSAIVTSGRLETTLRILKNHKIDKFFSFIITNEDCSRGKPWPDPYQIALRESKLNAKECLVIEDSLNGRQSAIKAGLECVLVHVKSGEGFQSIESLSEWLFK